MGGESGHTFRGSAGGVDAPAAPGAGTAGETCGGVGVTDGGGGNGEGTAGRRPHAKGSVPLTNAIDTTRTHSFDGSRSTGTKTIFSGTGKSSRGVSPSTLPMYETQIGTATREPVSSFPRLRGRS